MPRSYVIKCPGCGCTLTPGCCTTTMPKALTITFDNVGGGCNPLGGSQIITAGGAGWGKDLGPCPYPPALGPYDTIVTDTSFISFACRLTGQAGNQYGWDLIVSYTVNVLYNDGMTSFTTGYGCGFGFFFTPFFLGGSPCPNPLSITQTGVALVSNGPPLPGSPGNGTPCCPPGSADAFGVVTTYNITINS